MVSVSASRSNISQSQPSPRAWAMHSRFAELLETERHRIKETVLWDVDRGVNLTGPQISQAERQRTALFHRMQEFLQRYDYLILPVNQVPPFDVEQPYPSEIAGTKMESYIDWMKSCYFITVSGLPSISVPAGFTAEGLPVGIQIVGRHQDDFGVLQLAYAFERATECWKSKPQEVL